MEVAVSTIRLAVSMFAAAMALAVASLPAAGQVQFKRIVMSDQPVPGMPGVTFGDNFWDRANDNGDVLLTLPT